MRFRSQAEIRRRTAAGSLSRRGPSLRLAAMLGGLVLVLAAMARLQQPATHRALGRVLGEPVGTTIVANNDQPRLLPSDVFAEVRDNAPFRNDEQAAWFKTLSAVSRETPDRLSAVSSGAIGYASLTSQPDTYRGRVVTVSGTVQRVEAVAPAENDSGIQKLWRVTIEPSGGEVWPITVYTLTAPSNTGEPFEASAVGVFFKNLSYRWVEGVAITPVVVASRLETTIATGTAAAVETVSTAENQNNEVAFSEPAVGSLGRALLAELGVDLARLDTVIDRHRLSSKETVVFYDVLGAVSQTPATQLLRLSHAGLDEYVRRHAERVGTSARDRQTLNALQAEEQRQRYSVVPLFGDGKAERGELITIDAIVRRAVRVDTSGSEAATQRGVAYYYELEAFSEDSQNLPIVFAVRDLPAGFPVGDAIRQPARLCGFFFKQWAYRTRKRSEADPAKDRRQFAPLLIGRAPVPLVLPDASLARPGMAIGLAAVGGIAAIVLALWRIGRQDKRYEANTLSRYRRSREDGPLDFSHLEGSHEAL